MSFTDDQDVYTEEVVARYVDFYGHGADAFESLLVFNAARAMMGRHGRLLDVGCGPGIIHDWIDLAPGDYLGIDPSRPMVAEAQRRYPTYQYRHTSFEDYQCLGRWDVVLGAFGPLMHVRDLQPFARKLRRILAPDGRFLLMGAGEPHQHVRLLDGKSPETIYHTPAELRNAFGGQVYRLGGLNVVTNA
jgi:SAM-dependent methyltransferase